ncbi:hypothetical protein [Cellulomonas sp. APG4]|uniref:hypothetical protein n=1 Tax=Cellulomonas sp. APG4 TaxID=1538656 RepID=UPI00192A2F99
MTRTMPLVTERTARAAMVDVSVSQARTNLKLLFDRAVAGSAPTIRRSTTSDRIALVDAARLRATLEHLIPNPGAVVVHEEGEWAAFLPGLPISAAGATLDEAVDDLIVALREYAEDWADRLAGAPNHADRWGLVQLVTLSSDDELRTWLTATAA